jgi:hypothetical protein
MSEPTTTVREFLSDAYQLISSNSPNTTIPGRTQSYGLKVLNTLLHQYSANGLMITVEQQVDYDIQIGQQFVTFGEPDYTPTPDITTQGRLAVLENAWLTLDGVTYPLIDEKRTEFYSSYKYEPLMGLPRYIIVVPGTNLTTCQIFPSPSQVYTISFFGKFQLFDLTINTDLSELPTYYQLYLQYAVAKYLALYTGRAEAWTDKLEMTYQKLETDMVAVSPINLDININQESWLNGAWRVRSGI